jgi:hypothetical protein
VIRLTGNSDNRDTDNRRYTVLILAKVKSPLSFMWEMILFEDFQLRFKITSETMNPLTLRMNP